MCTNRACYEGECEACRKIDALVDWQPFGSKWNNNKAIAKSTEEKAEFKIFFDGIMNRAEILGNEYRNKLNNSNINIKEEENADTSRDSECCQQEPFHVQGSGSFRRKENVPAEGYYLWGQWSWKDNAPFISKEPDHHRYGRQL